MSKYGVNGAKFGDDIGVSLVMLSTELRESSHTMFHIQKAPTRTLLKALTPFSRFYTEYLRIFADQSTFNKEKAPVGASSEYCEVSQSPVDNSSVWCWWSGEGSWMVSGCSVSPANTFISPSSPCSHKLSRMRHGYCHCHTYLVWQILFNQQPTSAIE